MESKKYSLNRADGLKIAKGAGIAVGGALLTYLSQVLIEIDFGAYTPLAVAIGGILINAGIKFIQSKSV